MYGQYFRHTKPVGHQVVGRVIDQCLVRRGQATDEAPNLPLLGWRKRVCLHVMDADRCIRGPQGVKLRRLGCACAQEHQSLILRQLCRQCREKAGYISADPGKVCNCGTCVENKCAQMGSPDVYLRRRMSPASWPPGFSNDAINSASGNACHQSSPQSHLDSTTT